jgi:hypothetical protein
MYVMAELFIILGDDWGFLNKEDKTNLMAETLPLNLQNRFPLLHP